jgi:hypothetical protein
MLREISGRGSQNSRQVVTLVANHFERQAQIAGVNNALLRRQVDAKSFAIALAVARTRRRGFVTAGLVMTATFACGLGNALTLGVCQVAIMMSTTPDECMQQQRRGHHVADDRTHHDSSSRGLHDVSHRGTLSA